eukprot:TRINITY_DN1668_c0_g1_i1.p1 TRINITY_DN1668_c0_g1~~TRINITY_DN1668_c0_g1_i1.p1  ORF type:complete len:212 (+),score=29.49 TRINITY_DN1668_c0_g1_i1:82-636(+)
MTTSKEIVEKTALGLVHYYESLKPVDMLSKSQAAIKNRCKTIAEYLVQQLGVRPERWSKEERERFLPELEPVLSYTTKEWYKYNPEWKVRVAHMIEAPSLLTDLCDDDDSDVPTTVCPFDTIYASSGPAVAPVPQVQVCAQPTYQHFQTYQLHPAFSYQPVAHPQFHFPQATLISVMVPPPCCG